MFTIRVVWVRQAQLRRYLTLIAFCLIVQLALAQAPPSADTFVSSSTPNTNYGSSIALVIQSGGNAYIKFNLSTLPTGEV